MEHAMPIDFATLKVIWWLLLGILLAGFAIMDGFDLGVAMLFRFLARNDDERRVLLETIEPVWEGNQVWFILGGGAIFAAWPFVYAVSFSSFYLAMFLVLAAALLPTAGRAANAAPAAAPACGDAGPGGRGTRADSGPGQHPCGTANRRGRAAAGRAHRGGAGRNRATRRRNPA